MKHLLARTCVFSLAVTASLLAVAQSLPTFGSARFGEAVFGQASAGADALPVPFMPPMGNHHPRSCTVGCGLSNAF